MTHHHTRISVGDEHGVISVWFACAAMVMVLLVGMTVDLGGKVHTQQRAHATAAQAARTAAEQLQAPRAIRGQTPHIDTSRARLAAQAYLRTAGITGTVTITGGDTVVVRVTDTYHTRFLGIIGLGSMPVTGEASARLIRSEGGHER